MNDNPLAVALRDLIERCDINGGLGEYKGGQPFALKNARQALAEHGDKVLVPAAGLLAIRDALIAEDQTEAYHQLYSLVPWKDPFKPWIEWEAMLEAAQGEAK